MTILYDAKHHSYTHTALTEMVNKLTAQRTQAHRDILKKLGNTIKTPAMLAIARGKHDDDPIVQVTYLNRETAGKADLSIIKRTMGRLRDKHGDQRHVTLSGSGKHDAVLIAEGVETALSGKEALVNTKVICSLGIEQFRSLDHSRLPKTVVFLLDNDNKTINQNPALVDAIQQAVKQNKTVYTVMPDHLLGQGKTDLNDILQHKGKAGVQDYLHDAIKVEVKEAAKPEHELAECMQQASSEKWQKSDHQTYTELHERYQSATQISNPELNRAPEEYAPTRKDVEKEI